MSRRSHEAGFTLVELLLTISVLAVIMVPLGGALVVAFQTETVTGDRMSDSAAAQLLSMWLPRDAQSASSIDALQQTLPTYPSSCAASGDTVKLRLGWTDTDVSAATTATVVTYATRVVGGVNQLVRQVCSGAAITSVGSPATTQVLANSVTLASVPACPGSCSAVRSISMNVTLQTPTEAAKSISYSFSVVANRRPA